MDQSVTSNEDDSTITYHADGGFTVTGTMTPAAPGSTPPQTAGLQLVDEEEEGGTASTSS